jgi:S-adenosylmethionine hydrolase
MRPFISLNLFFLSLLVIATSCTKTETEFYPETPKTLVIVSDNDPGSDIMVGILGAVKSANPGIQIQYFQSKAFDVFQGSYLLYVVVMNYPKGTCITGIVEPGASSKRIVYQAGNEFIIAPDNTLSTRILNYYPLTQCYFIENPQVLGGAQPQDLSFEEFYKRAILSMISGTPLSAFGPVCTYPQKFQVQDPVISGDTIKGEILFTDNFGNCITNIPANLMSNIPIGSVLNLTSDTTHLTTTMGVSYSSVPSGDNVCFINSSQRLELAVNYGDFSDKYHLAAGSKIALRKQ